jgi:hypothetical protein
MRHLSFVDGYRQSRQSAKVRNVRGISTLRRADLDSQDRARRGNDYEKASRMTTPAKDSDSTVALRDRILKERDAGRIVFWGLPDELVAVVLDDFLKQPADGILYDLNRLEEVVLTWLPDPKWVNDFAVATVIRRLVATIERQQRELEELTESEDAYSDENAYLKRELAEVKLAWDASYKGAMDAISARDARIAVLVGALRTYGRHWSGCRFDGQPCDCGLDAALQGNKGEG